MTTKIKKFPSRYFWSHIRYFILFTTLGFGVETIISRYGKALIPESISIYLIYLIVALCLFILMLIISLRTLRPYRNLLKEAEKLPLEVSPEEKLRAIYEEGRFGHIALAMEEEQRNTQTRVNHIAEEKEKFESLIRSFPFPIITIDGNKQISFYNQEALKLYPKLEEEFFSESIFSEDILLKVNESFVQNSLAKIPSKKIKIFESPFIYQIYITPLLSPQSNSTPPGALLVFIPNDNNQVAQLISNKLLHGVLNHIISPIQNLESEEELHEDLRSQLEQIRLKAESFYQVFDIAGKELGKPKPFNLSTSLDQLFKVYKNRYPSKEVHLDDSMLKVKELIVYPELFQTALKNIISNCFKYGREYLSIRVKSLVDEDDLIIDISDNGKGISSQDLEGIFEYFYQQILQGQAPSDGKFHFGLSIIKAAIFHHGGRVYVISREGSGTTIRIKLPLSCIA